MERVFITGTAGFIGFHLAKLLLEEGYTVHGYDAMTDYYDVALKQSRQDILETMPGFTSTLARVEDIEDFDKAVDDFKPSVIVHLAAQAGVRYSLENPRSYITSNVVGTMNVIEAARRQGVRHLLMASTSSVYGANKEMPYAETHKADSQLTIYAATKKANESMGHAYANLWGLPTTMFRFFTVYGPWGRPDMAPIKFANLIANGDPIDIYNHGEMYRDFTYVTDLVRGIRLLMDAPPPPVDARETEIPGDSLSDAAPFRVVNIGNANKMKLLDFVDELEAALGVPAKRNYMEMQKGDVFATWADTRLLQNLTGFSPNTTVHDGIAQFIDWFKDYYQK